MGTAINASWREKIEMVCVLKATPKSKCDYKAQPHCDDAVRYYMDMNETLTRKQAIAKVHAEGDAFQFPNGGPNRFCKSAGCCGCPGKCNKCWKEKDQVSQSKAANNRIPVPKRGACDWGLKRAKISASCETCNRYKDGRNGKDCQYVPNMGQCFPDFWAKRNKMAVKVDCQEDNRKDKGRTDTAKGKKGPMIENCEVMDFQLTVVGVSYQSLIQDTILVDKFKKAIF